MKNTTFESLRFDGKRTFLIHWKKFAKSYKYKYQGQERQDELGLNWDSFKWRNYDYAIGRFMNIDPLTEKYNTWSPYAFSGNRVIDSRELEGLEPLHHTVTNDDGTKSHILEKNAVVLIERKRDIPQNATEKQVNSINRENAAIQERNQNRVDKIKQDLTNFYKLDSKEGFKNGAGEKVSFKVNFSTVEVDNTDGGDYINGMPKYTFAAMNGLKGADGQRAPAAVFTTNYTPGAPTVLGNTFGNFVDDVTGAEEGTASHEFAHTLNLKDNGYLKGGILGSPPAPPKSDEIDEMIRQSVPAK